MNQSTNTNQRVQIGFVGVGGMGQCAHLRNYVTIPECEVVSIAEPRAKVREAVACKYGVPRTYASAEEMLSNEKLDAIVAIQQFSHHGSILPPLYNAGVPILTEKPLTSSVNAGEKLLAALKASGAWHMVGYHKRSDPAAMCAKAEIDRLKQTCELGKLRYIRITMPNGDWAVGGFDGVITGDYARMNTPLDEGSEDQLSYKFINYYIHQVNLLRYLFGESYQVVFADKSQVLLVAQSESGVPGTIEMAPYETTLDWQESAMVAFEKGYVKIELPAPMTLFRPGRVEIFRDPGNGVAPQTIVPQLPWVHAMRQQAINFVRAVKGEIKPVCDAAEALEDLKIAREYIRLIRGE